VALTKRAVAGHELRLIDAALCDVAQDSRPGRRCSRGSRPGGQQLLLAVLSDASDDEQAQAVLPRQPSRVCTETAA
jgi:hypothetical protein